MVAMNEERLLELEEVINMAEQRHLLHTAFPINTGSTLSVDPEKPQKTQVFWGYTEYVTQSRDVFQLQRGASKCNMKQHKT